MLLDDSGNRVSRFKELNVSLLLTIMLMLAISLALVYSAGNAREDYTHFNKQIIFVCVGIVVLFGAMYISISSLDCLRNSIPSGSLSLDR